MELNYLNPTLINWDSLDFIKNEGATGFSLIKKHQMDAVSIRMIEYSENYIADHWCNKGHIVFVLNGELLIEHKEGETLTVASGMSYIIGDNSLPHKARTIQKTTVLIID